MNLEEWEDGIETVELALTHFSPMSNFYTP